MSDEQYDAALDLLRRLDPKNVSENLNTLCQLNQDLAEDLLSSVDKPLEIKSCPKSGKKFLCCDYNRDGDSYKSPWTGEYIPHVHDAPTLSADLRKLEEQANEAFDTYRELYYEGGLSSVYLWEQDNGFAGVVLLKKKLEKSGWNSIHVFDVDTSAGRQAIYRITSTIILDVGAKVGSKGKLDISGNLTRQTEKKLAIQSEQSHVANIGTLIEEVEFSMRNLLNEVYFSKTRDIVGDIRTVEQQSELKEEREKQRKVAEGLASR